MTAPTRPTQLLIEALIRETGAADAAAAVRAQAKQLIELYVATFGELTLPVNLDALASLRGIARSDDPPIHSPDAELVPDGSGGVTIRVSADKPETRQRFSIGHEICHTFFPDYTTKTWCRTDARHRDRSNPDDVLEGLCDIGAAELLFPAPWFLADAASVRSGDALVALAQRYGASREATARRHAETSPDAIASVYFVWKLKPTQQWTIARTDQQSFLDAPREEEIRSAMRLRIEYTIPSPSFRDAGYFLPSDKSVANEGPIYEAATSGQPRDGECHLDLGQAAGTYAVHAVPLWTPDEELGPDGQNAVVAILRPVKIRRYRKAAVVDPGLFDMC